MLANVEIVGIRKSVLHGQWFLCGGCGSIVLITLSSSEGLPSPNWCRRAYWFNRFYMSLNSRLQRSHITHGRWSRRVTDMEYGNFVMARCKASQRYPISLEFLF